MSKIKELPSIERPREKAVRFGIESLSNEELIAILLRTGTKDKSALDLAHTINSNFHGLFNLFQKPYHALLDIKGIGPGKALVLSACFELTKRYEVSRNSDEEIYDSKSIYFRYASKLRSSQSEMLVLVILNKERKIISEEIMYKGGEKTVECNPQEIIRKVILHNGKSFYLLHNHPSGNSSPSQEDIVMTMEVFALSKKVKIPLIDHIVVGNQGYFSFLESEVPPIIA